MTTQTGKLIVYTAWTVGLIACCAAGSTLLGQEEPVFLEDYLHRFEGVTTTTGLPKIKHYADAQREQQRVHLGRKLFFEPRFSRDSSLSCASCHRPDQAFSLNKKQAEGVSGKPGRRNVPSLLNRGFGTAQFWDGRAENLKAQSLQPIESVDELGHSIAAVVEMLQDDQEYRSLFEQAFDDGVNRQNLATAITAFEKSLLSGGSAIDRFQNSEQALTEQQRHGLWLYESKAACWRCHSGSTYTDEKFHNTGVSWGAEPLDLGQFEITKLDADRGKFKTPTLRDVALTAPYMHDGSIATLREVVEFYNRGGNRNPYLDEKMKPLELSEQEVDSLVEFLNALTGDHPWKSE